MLTIEQDKKGRFAVVETREGHRRVHGRYRRQERAKDRIAQILASRQPRKEKA